MKELSLGRVLGRGGFCVVNEVTSITLKEEEPIESKENGRMSKDEHYIHNIVQDRSFMARHFTRQGKDYRYAIKRVQEKSKVDPEHYVNAVVDLATEARFLAVVRHANIIKMRAMDDASPYTYGFFVVLDKLYDIMPSRLRKWKKQQGGALSKMFKSKNSKTNFWVERLSVAYDLSCALSYLHGMRYVFPTKCVPHTFFAILVSIAFFTIVTFFCIQIDSISKCDLSRSKTGTSIFHR